MKNSIVLLLLCSLVALATPAQASLISVDLGAAVTGPMIVTPQASFAQSFVGQTVSGIGILGSPSDPLTLSPGGLIEVDPWEGTNSLLPQPGNQAPLSILFATQADEFSWRMGSAEDPGPLTIDFFSSTGSLVHEASVLRTTGYDNYLLGGFGSFAGLTIFNNSDPAGLRFYNMGYNSVGGTVTPEPASLALLGLGLAGLGSLRKRFARK